MFRIDLHVHTRRYSQCAEALDPHALGMAARRSGLDGILITEHDAMWSAEEMRDMQRIVQSVRLFRGVEATTPDGHFIALGIDGLRGIAKNMNTDELIDCVHAAGGIVVFVHPQRSRKEFVGTQIGSLCIDAVEVFSDVTVRGYALAAHDLARQYDWAEVAGSDAHAPDVVGSASTLFPYGPVDEHELADMIRCRLGKPCLRGGE